MFSGHTILFFISNAVPDFSADDFCCGRIKIRFKHRISSASPKSMQIEEPISIRQLFQHRHRPATAVAACCYSHDDIAAAAFSCLLVLIKYLKDPFEM